MKRIIKYNYKEQKRILIPDKNGKYKYNSYHKYDVVFKNDSSESIDNVAIKFKFNKRNIIRNIIVAEPNIYINYSSNIATITFYFFDKNQIYHLDFFVANCDINDKIEIEPVNPELDIKRSKKIIDQKNKKEKTLE